MKGLRRYFPAAVYHRCTVHYLRNALAKVTAPALAVDRAAPNGTIVG